MNTNQTNENAKAGDPLELEINGEKVIFRYCPPGTFVMGSPKDEQDRYDRELHPEKIEIIMCNGVLYDDEALHEVTLSRGFWLLETPVTEELWIAVKHSLVDSYSEGHQPDCPVTCVRWVDCAAFIDELNASGIAPSGMKFDFPTAHGGCTICTATLRSGVKMVPTSIGIISYTQKVRLQLLSIPKVRQATSSAFCAAAVGIMKPSATGIAAQLVEPS